MNLQFLSTLCPLNCDIWCVVFYAVMCSKSVDNAVGRYEKAKARLREENRTLKLLIEQAVESRAGAARDFLVSSQTQASPCIVSLICQALQDVCCIGRYASEAKRPLWLLLCMLHFWRMTERKADPESYRTYKHCQALQHLSGKKWGGCLAGSNRCFIRGTGQHFIAH